MSHPLSPEDRQRVETLFEQAADLPPDEHAGFLERHCGTDGPLRAELARLLAGLAGEDVLGQIQSAVPTRVGTRIGPYELLEKVGEGGMGEVYAAQQLEPVRRKVALKLIKTGMDTRQVIARFEAERQALAMMDHPHIAKVLDGGSTGSGQPYFVMEFIEGVPIIEYCDRHRLDTKARLRLFVKVCHAIQHAHQKGLIHRDIKPSNVQVTLHDGVPAPKVIDFGVAKATHTAPATGAALTQNLQLVGTPAYMSPEQAGTTEQDIDTRSDIYSLGVLLYELLTGTTPFDAQQLSEANLAELVRLICEETPHKPSTRISTLGDAATNAAVRQRIDGRRLALDLRGDLDWIVMKCLEKDRARRYETANGLAADLERHLRDEPVTAGPPSKSYRVRKFVRRNRAGVIAAGLIALVLLLGAGGTTWGMLWALDETERADKEATAAILAATAEAKARADETQRAEELQQVADFQTAQLGQTDPMTMGDRMRRTLITAVPEERREQLEQALHGINFTDLALATLEHDILQPSLEAIDAQFEGQWRVQAQLLSAVASSAHSVGLYELATDPMERAWAIRAKESDPDDWTTMSALNGRGVLLFSKGRYDEAEPHLRKASEGLRSVLGNDDLVTLNSVDCLGDLLRAQGKLTEAEECYREVLAGRHGQLGHDHRDTLESLRVLGAVLRQQGRFEEAEDHLERALEGQLQAVGEDDRSTLRTLNSLAVLYHSQGRLGEAESYHRRSLEGSRNLLGNDHPATLMSISNLGAILLLEFKLTEAELLSQESVERHLAVLGGQHPSTLLALADRGALLVQMGKLVEAEECLSQALEGQSAQLGEDHESTMTTLHNLGTALRRLGRSAEAEPLLRLALEGQSRLHPGDNRNKLTVISTLAGALKDLGRRGDAALLEESEELYREALAGRLRMDEESKEAFMAMDNLAVLLQMRGKFEEAEDLYRQALEGERRLLGETSIDTLITGANLGNLLVATKQFDEAEPLLKDALEEYESQLPEHYPLTVSARNNLGILRRDQGRHAEAEELFRKSLEGLRLVYPKNHPNTLGTLRNLGFVLLAQGRPEEALPFLLEALEGFKAHGNFAMVADLQALHDKAKKALEQEQSAGEDGGS